MAHPTFNQPKKSGDYYRTLYNQSERKLRDEPGSSASSMSSQGPSKYTYAKRRDYSTDPIVQATRHFTGQLNQSTQVLELLMKTLKKNVEEMNKKLNNMADALAQFKVTETLDKKERENPVRTVFKSLYGLDSRKSTDNANSVTESVGHIENSITELQKTLLYLGNLIAINQPDTVSLQQTTIHSSAIHEGSHPQSTGPSTSPFHVPPRPSILPCKAQPIGDHTPNNATWPLNSPSQSSSRASDKRPSNHPLSPFHAASEPSTRSYAAHLIGHQSEENDAWPLNSFSQGSHIQSQAKATSHTRGKKREIENQTLSRQHFIKHQKKNDLCKKPDPMSSISSDQPFGHEGNPQSGCLTLGSNIFNHPEESTDPSNSFLSNLFEEPKLPQTSVRYIPLSERTITYKEGSLKNGSITPTGIGEDPSLDTWTKKLLQQPPLEK